MSSGRFWKNFQKYFGKIETLRKTELYIKHVQGNIRCVNVSASVNSCVTKNFAGWCCGATSLAKPEELASHLVTGASPSYSTSHPAHWRRPGEASGAGPGAWASVCYMGHREETPGSWFFLVQPWLLQPLGMWAGRWKTVLSVLSLTLRLNE